MKRRVTRQEWKLRLRVARQIIGENQVSASVHENQLGPEDCAVSLLRDGENSLPVADGETSLCTDQFDCTDFSDYSSFPTEESARDAIGNALTRVSESEESSTLENNLAEANSQDSEISEEDTYNDSMCLSDLSDYCTTSDDEITELSTTDHEPSTTPLQCLYPGSNVSKNDFNVAMLSISHKHSLTNSCLVDILNLFSEVLPMGTQTSSRHMLMRSFVDYNEEITVHRCCGYCSRLLSDLSCDLPECQAAEVSDSSFIQICLVKQLQTLFSGLYQFAMFVRY